MLKQCIVASLFALGAAQQEDKCNSGRWSEGPSMLQKSTRMNTDERLFGKRRESDFSVRDDPDRTPSVISPDDASLHRQHSARVATDEHLIGFRSQSQQHIQTKIAVPDFHAAMPITKDSNSSDSQLKASAGHLNQGSVAFAMMTSLKEKLRTLADKLTVAFKSYFEENSETAITIGEMETEAQPSEISFRPVSVTLRCVLALTFLFLATYTALAFFRNVDELSGCVKPSLLTETLTVAARTTTYAPMLAVLFLACRMYVLQSSGGKGEPTAWAKAYMTAATIGLFIGPLLVCLLPLVLQHSSRRAPFTKLSGLACKLDVHPQLFRYGEEYDKAFKHAGVMQMVALLPVYGGVAGTIISIFAYPAKNAVSPAVVATVVLATWYFLIYAILFIARTRQQLKFVSEQKEALSPETTTLANNLVPAQEEHLHIGDSKLLKFALNASYPMDTAAMFAVLFLGARLRAVQFGKEPVGWIQACFTACAVALPLLSLLNGIAGMNSSEHLGYYGEKLYHADSKGLLIGKHVVAAILYISTMVVMIHIYATTDSSPLSTTLQSLLQLSCQFFLVYAFHWVIAATHSFVFKGNWTLIVESSVLAARNSVQFCPILAILFVSCRMRALQITQQKGNPQGWAQDAMDIIMAATNLQILCCLTLPIFTGIATKTDNEGNAEYDLQPLIGAYVVTCMKYFTLFLVFGGVAVVGVSMFVITPETARSDNIIFSGGKGMLSFVCSFILVLMICMALSSAKVIGLAVKLAIESADRMLLGVDVNIGAARLSICRGFVNLADIVVQNPKGYKTPYLLSVGKIVVKLNVMKLVSSLGKLVEIEALILSDVDIIFEKSISSSNVQDVLKHLEGDTTETQETEKKVEEPGPEPVPQPEPDTNQLQVVLHRVDILEVGAKVAATFFGGSGVRVALGNIEYEDFQGQCDGQVQVSEVMKIILETLMKTVLANSSVVGESIAKAAQKVAKAAQKVEKVAHEAEAKIGKAAQKAEHKILAGVSKIGEKASKAAHWFGGGSQSQSKDSQK